MNKRLIAFLSILSLSLLLPLIPAHSATKAGAKCTKLGITSVAGNKTFTCIKSRKKLVWNKGVSKSTVTAPVDIPISIDNLDLKGVPQKAYDNVIKVLKSSPRASYEPTKFIGANVVQARVDQELAGLERAIDLWAPYFKPDKFQVIYVVRGDEEWLEKKSTELGLSSMLPPGETWTDRMKAYTPCGSAAAGLANQIPTFVQCLNVDFRDGYRQTGAHEYTHLFQRDYGGTNLHKIPWYTEGSASFFGWTLGFYPDNPNFFGRSSWLNNIFSGIGGDATSDFKSKDMQRFKNRMKLTVPEGGGQATANVSYWVGGLATEVLVALYGFDKFVEFTKNMQSSRDMSALLTQTYGFSEDYFYEKLAPYVWAQIPVY
jgi:hypothetical protein